MDSDLIKGCIRDVDTRQLKISGISIRQPLAIDDFGWDDMIDLAYEGLSFEYLISTSETFIPKHILDYGSDERLAPTEAQRQFADMLAATLRAIERRYGPDEAATMSQILRSQ